MRGHAYVCNSCMLMCGKLSWCTRMPSHLARLQGVTVAMSYVPECKRWKPAHCIMRSANPNCSCVAKPATCSMATTGGLNSLMCPNACPSASPSGDQNPSCDAAVDQETHGAEIVHRNMGKNWSCFCQLRSCTVVTMTALLPCRFMKSAGMLVVSPIMLYPCVNANWVALDKLHSIPKVWYFLHPLVSRNRCAKDQPPNPPANCSSDQWLSMLSNLCGLHGTSRLSLCALSLSGCTCSTLTLWQKISVSPIKGRCVKSASKVAGMSWS